MSSLTAVDSTAHEYVTAGILRWRRYTDGPLLVLAIGSLPLLLLEFKRAQLSHADRVFLDLVNVAVLVAFAVDSIVEISLTRKRGMYARREWTSAVIVVAQAVALFPALAGFGALRAFRAARLFRVFAVVLRLFAVGGAAAKEGRTVIRRKAAQFDLSLAGFTWLASAAAFTLVEDVGEGARVHSFGDALWWSLSTITTVGYGDIYPVTPLGRIIGGFTMIVGISTFAVVTAKVAEFLVRADIEDRKSVSEGISE